MHVKLGSASVILAALLISGFSIGCGGDGDGETTGLTCGAGTLDKSGVCTPEEAAGVLTCGDDTKEVEGKCVAKISDAKGFECGAGTTEKDGKCLADTTDTKTCGTGTTEKDGVCEADKVSPGVECGQGTIEEAGKCVPELNKVEGFEVTKFDMLLPKGGKALVGYPVTVNVALKSKTPFAAHLQVTMTNYTEGMDEKDIYQCFVGGIAVKSPGNGEVVEISNEFFIPQTCLYGKAATGDKDATATLYPVLSFNEDDDLVPTDINLASIRFAKDEKGISGCTSEGVTSDKKCAYEIPIANAGGIDIKLTKAASSTSVIVMQTVPDSVVKGPAGDMVYGAPEISMDVEITAYGPSVVDEKGEPLNLLEEDELEVRYSIRPADAKDDEEWEPIFLHEEGDPAKADDEVTIGNLDSAVETNVIAQAPHYYTHGLYIEDDCGTPCGAEVCNFNDSCTQGGYCKLDPAKGECSKDADARTAIMLGKWKDDDKFVIKSCMTSTLEKGGDSDEECTYDEIFIVRVDNSNRNNELPITTGDGNLASVPSASKSFKKSWGTSTGGDWLKLAAGFSSESAIRYWTPGVGTANSAHVTLSSSKIGLTYEIIKGWLNGHVVADKGWAYDIGLKAIGKKLWGTSDSKKNAFKYTKKWKTPKKEYSKTVSKSFNFMAGPVPITIEFGITGKMFITAGFDLEAGFTKTDAYASGKPWVTPGASITGFAKGGINLALFKGGLGISLKIVLGTLPASFTLKVTADPVVKKNIVISANVKIEAKVSTLDGALYVWVDQWKVSCANWRPWSCSSGYKNIWKKNLFSFAGLKWTFPIYNQTWSKDLCIPGMSCGPSAGSGGIGAKKQVCGTSSGCNVKACRAAVGAKDGWCKTHWDGYCGKCATGGKGYGGVNCSSAKAACMQ
jgi:hypothetical protein